MRRCHFTPIQASRGWSKREAVQRDGNHPETYTNASSGNQGGKKDSKSIKHVQPSGRKKRMGSEGRQCRSTGLTSTDFNRLTHGAADGVQNQGSGI